MGLCKEITQHKPSKTEISTMKNLSNKNKWNGGTVRVNMGPPPIPLIKSKNDTKSDKYCAEIKLCRDQTSENSDLYEFKMSFFDNCDMEEFLLFISNSNMNLEASGVIVDSTKIHHLCTLVHGEVLRQFDTLYADVGSTTSENLKYIILGLST